jgi:hypothetical protein
MDTMTATTGAQQEKLLGYLAEFSDPHQLLHACEQVRDAKYRRWDAHTPFPVHGLNDAMGLRGTVLPWLVLGGGLTGLLAALVMQWWMNAVDYPFLISGKPYFSLPAFIPVVFELTVLLSAISTFFGMLMLAGLPQFYHPVFHSERFKRASDDHFFISIEARDRRFDAVETKRLLEGLDGVLHVEPLIEEAADAH